jgi:hypothetical protein
MSADQWTDAYLASLRQTGDPLADEVIAHVYRSGERQAVNELWLQLLHNDRIPTEGVCPEVVQYLDVSSKLPDWARPDTIRVGEDLFMEHGLFALASLLCASLPECYVMKNGVHVLWATQRLEEHTFRRLFETAQMVVAVMAPGGLSPAGSGVRAAQKVRLMHAAIRHLILRSPKADVKAGPPKGFADVLATMNWDQEKLGYPINQEDLAYTLLTFSYVIPRAMERLGAKITAAQQEAYLHCWNVVGYVMGVREELLPANLAEAGLLFARIRRLEGGHSEAGEKLTAALIQCVESVLPNRWMKRLPRLLVRQLVGEPTADLLGAPKPTLLERAVMAMLREVERVAEDLWRWITGKASRKVGEAWVRCLTQMPRGWNRQLFDLPESLATSWGIRKSENRS